MGQFPLVELAEMYVNSQTPSRSGPKSWNMEVFGSKNNNKAQGGYWLIKGIVKIDAVKCRKVRVYSHFPAEVPNHKDNHLRNQ